MRSPLGRYQVNVLDDHRLAAGAPLVYEDRPTLQNLIGRIEHVAQMGTPITDFAQIKAGALHRANGGWLILDGRRLLAGAVRVGRSQTRPACTPDSNRLARGSPQPGQHGIAGGRGDSP
jgi:hypothetical protein